MALENNQTLRVAQLDYIIEHVPLNPWFCIEIGRPHKGFVESVCLDLLGSPYFQSQVPPATRISENLRLILVPGGHQRKREQKPARL